MVINRMHSHSVDSINSDEQLHSVRFGVPYMHSHSTDSINTDEQLHCVLFGVPYIQLALNSNK